MEQNKEDPHDWKLTEELPLALRRKLAVWAAVGGWLGIGRWPSAMPTMAVMWVSVPKTWIGIPVVFPAHKHIQKLVRCEERAQVILQWDQVSRFEERAQKQENNKINES